MTRFRLRPEYILAAAICWQLAIGALYATRTPAWQAPDEPAHFNYARDIAEGRGLPVLVPGDYDEVYLANIKNLRFPVTMPVDPIRYESHQPPAYYLLGAPFLKLGGSDPRNQLLMMRLVGVALGGVLIFLLFRLYRLLFPGRATLAAAAAALPALIPQHLSIFASASNDSLTSVVVALAIWRSMAIIAGKHREGREPTTRDLLILGAVCALAVLTKVTAYVALPLALFAVVISTGRPRWPRAIALFGALPALAIGGWFGRNMTLYGPFDPLGLARHDAVVLGQPLTGLWTLQTVRTIVAIGFQSFWGQFGWMGVLMDGWVYGLLWAGSLFAVIGFMAAISDYHRYRISIDRAGALGLWLLAGLGGLIFAGFLWYNLKYFQPQGRYLFAAMPVLALLIAGGFRYVFSAKLGWWMVGIAYLGLAFVDVYAVLRYIEPQLRY